MNTETANFKIGQEVAFTTSNFKAKSYNLYFSHVTKVFKNDSIQITDGRKFGRNGKAIHSKGFEFPIGRLVDAEWAKKEIKMAQKWNNDQAIKERLGNVLKKRKFYTEEELEAMTTLTKMLERYTP